MKTIGASLLAHLQSETTTLATLWKVTRVDGTVFGFTDHNEDLTVSGVVYSASSGYTRSAIRASLGLAPDDMEVEGVLSASTLNEDEIRAGLWDYATIDIYMVNWADTSMGAVQMTRGRLGQIRSGRQTFTAELLGLSKHLQQAFGRLYTPGCDADLGDSRCRVDLNGSPGLTVVGTVTSTSSNRVFADTSLTQASGYFDGGKITWTSGLNDGLSMEVKTYTRSGSPLTNALALQLPMPYTVAVGDAYSMHAGCDKTFATCGTKFSNVLNYQGFPHVPGVDRLLSGGLQ